MKYFLAFSLALILTIGLSHKAFAVSPPNTTDPTPTPTTQVQYQMLAPLPGLTNTGEDTTDIATYIPNAVKLIIGLSLAAAVILIILGGMKYVLSASVGAKGDGREMIYNAVIGLLLVIGSWVILNTINPDLVKFSLSLDNVGSSVGMGTGLSDTGSTAPNCTGCVPLTGVPVKPPGQGCSGTAACTVDPSMVKPLQKLAGLLDGKVAWRVTEMFPPTVPHISACHDAGTCVDASITNQPASISDIATFLTQVKSVFGDNYIYESCTRLSQLQSDPKLKGFKFACVSTTQGENVHINAGSGSSGTF